MLSQCTPESYEILNVTIVCVQFYFEVVRRMDINDHRQTLSKYHVEGTIKVAEIHGLQGVGSGPIEKRSRLHSKANVVKANRLDHRDILRSCMRIEMCFRVVIIGGLSEPMAQIYSMAQTRETRRTDVRDPRCGVLRRGTRVPGHALRAHEGGKDNCKDRESDCEMQPYL